MDTPTLLSPYRLGDLALANRVVMAPMTRCRAVDNRPGELEAHYYAQRAQAGLLITEGTAPGPNGLGYARIPGVYAPDQVTGWSAVADAVHEAGGRLFMQLMHVGRIAHPANMPAGAEIVAPSGVAAAGKMYTDSLGLQDHPTPRAMESVDIAQTIREFVQAARNAVDAGFDGVELHGANGYLLDQFLNPGANRRADAYGGSIEGRCRFVLEVARAVADAIGAQRTGIRLSPYGVFNDQVLFDEIDAQYTYLAAALGRAGLAYLHLVDHSSMGTPEVPRQLKQAIRDSFAGTLILSGGYDAARAEADLSAGLGDLVAFGRPFIANPDLVARFAAGAPLAAADSDTFYTPGAAGYLDYPALDAGGR